MTDKVPVIIVSHNSAAVLPLCLRSLDDQRGCIAEVTIVDSGSDDTLYLKELQDEYGFRLIEEENVGFSRANNIGYSSLSSASLMVIFCNPDAILPADYLRKASSLLKEHPRAGIISGSLQGFNPASGQPTGLYDSTGVFRKWYGRWYDRDQGCPVESISRSYEEIPAVCGALLVCRREAIDREAPNVFDPDFFLYKEDIELSLRLRKRGWTLHFMPELVAFHCRGWNHDRKSVSRELREYAAKSEVTLYRKHLSPYIVWALAKLAGVRLFGM